MAHFAQIDDSNLVISVVVVDNKDTSDAAGVEKEHIGAAHLEKILGGTWKQTSYNGNFRKNYAGIGYTFDSQRNAFIPPKPFNSWVLVEETCSWKAPVDMPVDAGTGDPPKMYSWNETTVAWEETTPPN